MASNSFGLVQTMANIPSRLWDHANQLTLISQFMLLAGLASGVYFAKAAVKNYRLYIALGPGGVNYGIRGWLFNWLIWPVASTDLCSTEMYDDPKARKEYGEYGCRSFLREDNEKGEGLRPRGKPRPDVPEFAAPQRQYPGTGNDGDFSEQQHEYFHHLAQLNPDLLRVDTSGLEKRGPALFTASNVHAPEPVDGHTKGEIGHFHLLDSDDDSGCIPDGSGHVTLSLEDAKEVIAKGWGQRHMMSGRLGAKIVGKGFVLVYAPQDKEELEVMKRIFKAGATYMASGRKIKV